MSHYFLLNASREAVIVLVHSVMIISDQSSSSGSRYRFFILCNYILLRYYWHNLNKDPNKTFSIPPSLRQTVRTIPKHFWFPLASEHLDSETKIATVKRGKKWVAFGKIQNLLLGCLLMAAVVMFCIIYHILIGLSSMYRIFCLSAW